MARKRGHLCHHYYHIWSLIVPRVFFQVFFLCEVSLCKYIYLHENFVVVVDYYYPFFFFWVKFCPPKYAYYKNIISCSQNFSNIESSKGQCLNQFLLLIPLINYFKTFNLIKSTLSYSH